MGTSTKRLYLRLQADLGAEFDRVVSVKEGSNSLVCFARRILDGHEVAIKVIDCRALIDDEQEAIKLVREIQALKYFAALKAPVCVRYEDSFYSPAKEDSLLYVVTEKMEQSFAEVLDARGHLSEDEAKCVFYELLLITAYEHGCGWVHRDRKPENILFSLTDFAKRQAYSLQNLPAFTKSNMQKYYVFKDCDFGLARAITTDHTSSSLTPPETPVRKTTSSSSSSSSPSSSSSSPSLSSVSSASCSSASSSSSSASSATPSNDSLASLPLPPPVAAFLRNHSMLVATTSYKPLETLLREFDHVAYAAIPSLTAIDMWANGVMLAEMLVGQVFPAVAYGMGDETECEIKSLLAVLPLTAEKKKIALSYLKRRSPGIRLLEEAVCEESVFDRMASLQISKLAIDLASRILDVDPAARLSAMDALKHPWFAAVRNEPREAALFQGLPRKLDEWVLETHDKHLSVPRIKQFLHRTVSGIITESMRPLKRRSTNDGTGTPARRSASATPSRSSSNTPSRSSKLSRASSFSTPSQIPPLEEGALVVTPWGSAKLVRKIDDGWNAVFSSNQKLLHVKMEEILSPSTASSSSSSSSASSSSPSPSKPQFVLPPSTPQVALASCPTPAALSARASLNVPTTPGRPVAAVATNTSIGPASPPTTPATKATSTATKTPSGRTPSNATRTPSTTSRTRTPVTATKIPSIANYFTAGPKTPSSTAPASSVTLTVNVQTTTATSIFTATAIATAAAASSSMAAVTSAFSATALLSAAPLFTVPSPPFPSTALAAGPVLTPLPAKYLASFGCLPTEAISPEDAFMYCRAPSALPFKSTTVTSTFPLSSPTLVLPSYILPIASKSQMRTRGRPRKGEEYSSPPKKQPKKRTPKKQSEERPPKKQPPKKQSEERPPKKQSGERPPKKQRCLRKPRQPRGRGTAPCEAEHESREMKVDETQEHPREQTHHEMTPREPPPRANKPPAMRIHVTLRSEYDLRKTQTDVPYREPRQYKRKR